MSPARRLSCSDLSLNCYLVLLSDCFVDGYAPHEREFPPRDTSFSVRRPERLPFVCCYVDQSALGPASASRCSTLRPKLQDLRALPTCSTDGWGSSRTCVAVRLRTQRIDPHWSVHSYLLLVISAGSVISMLMLHAFCLFNRQSKRAMDQRGGDPRLISRASELNTTTQPAPSCPAPPSLHTDHIQPHRTHFHLIFPSAPCL